MAGQWSEAGLWAMAKRIEGKAITILAEGIPPSVDESSEGEDRLAQLLATEMYRRNGPYIRRDNVIPFPKRMR